MLRTHPHLPFECTYHFIGVGPQAFVLLDVIRSPQGNSLRFFYIEAGKLQHHETINEPQIGGSELSPLGDSIKRSVGPLTFELKFTVLQSAGAVAPINPFRIFAITAKDHPAVKYAGTINYQPASGTPRSWTLAGAPGTISQHYGRTLPEYLYFTTYSDGQTPQLVGAISRVNTAFGFRVVSSYVSLTKDGRKPHTVLSLRPSWHRNANGTTVRSRHGELSVELGTQPLSHQIDHAPGKTWFNACISLPALGVTPLPALVETRGSAWKVES